MSITSTTENSGGGGAFRNNVQLKIRLNIFIVDIFVKNVHVI